MLRSEKSHFSVIFITLTLWIQNGKTDRELEFRATSLKCDGHPDYVRTPVNCKIRILKDRTTAITILPEIIGSIEEALMNFKVLKKYGNQYRPTTVNVTFKACDFITGKQLNPLVRIIHNWIEKNSVLPKECPFFGEVGVKDLIPLPNDIPVPVPLESYIFDFLIFKIDPFMEILSFKLYESVLQKRSKRT